MFTEGVLRRELPFRGQMFGLQAYLEAISKKGT